jgi:hypothetical protein
VSEECLKFSPDPFPKVEPIPDQDLDEPSLPLVATAETIDANKRFHAPVGTWNLEKFRYVEFDLKNPGKSGVKFSCWVFARDGWGGSGTFPEDNGFTFLEPGESATVRIDLHSRFFGKENETRSKKRQSK